MVNALQLTICGKISHRKTILYAYHREVTVNSPRIGVIDLGIGNAASVSSMLTRSRISNQIVSKPEELSAHDRIILPGVGNFGAFTRALRLLGFEETLNHLVLQEGKPTLGICVGAQIFLEGSEEDHGELGLGYIAGTNLKISELESRFVPRVGWDSIKVSNVSDSLEELDGNRFYFTHSYKLDPLYESEVIAYSKFGTSIPAVIRKNNVLGVQFHPEKSLENGMNFLADFSYGKFDVS